MGRQFPTVSAPVILLNRLTCFSFPEQTLHISRHRPILFVFPCRPKNTRMSIVSQTREVLLLSLAMLGNQRTLWYERARSEVTRPHMPEISLLATFYRTTNTINTPHPSYTNQHVRLLSNNTNFSLRCTPSTNATCVRTKKISSVDARMTHG